MAQKVILLPRMIPIMHISLDLIVDLCTGKIPSKIENSRMYHSTPHTLLDAYLFPNGHMLNEHFDKLEDTVVFHANWNSERSQKEDMLKKMGMWYLRSESDALD